MIARYLSWPAVSQICAFTVFPSIWKDVHCDIYFVAVRFSYLHASSGEFYTYSWLWLQAKFIPGESGKQVRFANSGVTNQDDFKEVIVTENIFNRKNTYQEMITYSSESLKADILQKLGSFSYKKCLGAKRFRTMFRVRDGKERMRPLGAIRGLPIRLFARCEARCVASKRAKSACVPDSWSLGPARPKTVEVPTLWGAFTVPTFSRSDL